MPETREYLKIVIDNNKKKISSNEKAILRVHIIDSGIGISELDQQKLF